MAGKSEGSLTHLDYEVDYRDVKHARLEYKTGRLMLILPKNYESQQNLLEKYGRWIAKKENIIRQALEEANERKLNMERTKEELKTMVESTVDRYSKEYGFRINRIFFRKMKTKWGSHSSRGNLTVNTLLKYLPRELIEYIVFHELVHSQERRHNERFWQITRKEFKSYPKHEKDLLVYWFLVQEWIGRTD